MKPCRLNGYTADIDQGSFMSIWDSFLGHAQQREMFRRTIRRKRLSQSYLFIGPDGVGKQLFARKLAQCLLCLDANPEDPLEPCGDCAGCRPFQAGSHPDFLFVGCPEGKRELPISLLLGSDDRRGQEGLCHDLSLAPLPGSRKIAIVDDADTMNEASANAFLKTLEEPPARAVLLLIASNLAALLPTIRSRCQMVRFAPLDRKDIEALLVKQDLVQSADDAAFASSLCDGSLTVACQLLDPELRALRGHLYAQLSKATFSGFGLAKQMIDGLNTISTETSAQRRNAQWLIRFAIEFFRSAVWLFSGGSSESIVIAESRAFANRFPSRDGQIDLLGGAIERLVDAARHLDQNVTVALCLESLFDDLSRLLKPQFVTR
jgi:DNA polymerase-3 subunit delta'